MYQLKQLHADQIVESHSIHKGDISFHLITIMITDVTEALVNTFYNRRHQFFY